MQEKRVIDDTYDQIKAMGARYISIVTRNNAEYLIPNEDLITHQVVNWSFSKTLIRIKITVGVAYDSDIRHVRELMVSVARTIDRVLDEPPPVCHLENFGDHAIELELRFWIKDPENGISGVSSSVRMAIWDAFQTYGINIPIPQQVVHLAEKSCGARILKPAENRKTKLMRGE